MLAMLEADGPGAKRERRRRLAALSSAVGALVLGRVLRGRRLAKKSSIPCAPSFSQPEIGA